jgi:CDP-glycerol glycerophosphotransferase (TagB/SpsB family)
VQAIKKLTNLDAQLLIRLYLVGKINLGDIVPIPQKIAIDDPGGGANFIQTDLTLGDSHLADLLYHSDVVVAFASTLAIDAVVFNKPIVFIGFDGESRPYWQSVKRFYDLDHQQFLLKIGGIKFAKNLDELKNYIQEYLNNPNLDDSGRKKIIYKLCWRLDGKSSERLADVLIKFLENCYPK